MRSHLAAITCILILATSCPLAAQERPIVLGISHVAVKASDVEKSVAFYRDFLGFAEEGRLNNTSDGSLMLVFMKVSDEQSIEIFDARKLKPESDRLYQFALQVADAQGMRDQLAARGFKGTLPRTVPRGQIKNANFTVSDPHGYTIEFVQYMPDGQTIRDKGKFLSDSRISDHIIHAGIAVDDFDASAHFYRDLLGFKDTWRGSKDDKTLAWVHMGIPGGRDSVELMLEAKPEPHFCLEVPDVPKAKDKLEKTAYFKSYGRTIETKVGRNGKRQLNLWDPEGIRVELMEPQTADGKPVPSSNAPLPTRKQGP
jgi:catechol 2,3-dioxygenase-like lactoylglutathione lyase family enzyme